MTEGVRFPPTHTHTDTYSQTHTYTVYTVHDLAPWTATLWSKCQDTVDDTYLPKCYSLAIISTKCS